MDPDNQPDPEHSVDWDAADPAKFAAALTAGEGDGEGAAFEPRSFKYNGKLVTAHSADEAAVLEELIHENRSHRGRAAAADAALRERIAHVEGRLEAGAAPAKPEPLPEPEFPSIELARTDPERWRQDIIAWKAAGDIKAKFETDERIRVELAKKDDEIAKRFEKESADKRNRQWAEGFYAKYDHLDNEHRRLIVQGVFRQHVKEMDAYGDDTASAYERLAELSDAAIAEVAGVPSARISRDTTRPPRLEGPSRASVKTPETTREHFTGAKWLGKERARMRGDGK